MGIDLIWFGVIIAMNLQTSFLTPPFGFALFYLRSVAPRNDYKDRVTGAPIKAVTTTEIYKGSIAFIVLQLIMVAAIIAYPSLVTGSIEKVKNISDDAVMQMLDQGIQREAPNPMSGLEPAPAGAAPGAPAASATAPAPAAPSDNPKDDPMKALQEAAERDKKK